MERGMLPEEGDELQIRVGGDMDHPLIAIFDILRRDEHRDIYMIQLKEVKPMEKED